MKRRKKVIKTIRDYSLIILGTFITAVSVNVFMVPFKIAPGGLSGLATVIYYLSGGIFPVGATMLIMNAPLFFLGIKFIGRKFVIRTLCATVLLSLIIDATGPLAFAFVEEYLRGGQSNPTDMLLYSLFGGFLMGAGLGLVFRYGATTGGTDLAARIINRFIPHFTLGQLLLLIDTAIIVFATVSFKSFILGLYSIVTLYVSSKVIDAVVEGVNFAKGVLIISDHSDEIARRIMTELDRGVTALKGIGMYTGTDKKVLLCILDRSQITALKNIVKTTDPGSFIILSEIREVLGEGFKTYE